ncbi:MAG: DUF2259 domain-containing protein [Bacteroidetes bacterium]|nr:DUF2259 domain-containing protein [Bacteroidota bacterium]
MVSFRNIVLVIGVFTSTVLAGDRSSYEVIGFSKDGRYVAFERFGTYDGSGFPYCTVFILDVKANDFCVRPIEVTLELSDTENEPDARSVAKANAAEDLVRFGIVKGNGGKRIWTADAGAITSQVRFIWRKQLAELELKEREVDRECDPAGPGKIFELDLRFDDGTSVTMQKDTELPSSRGCAFDYRLEEVVLFGNAIGVFINVSSTGYEGPNERQILVTALIEP